MKKLLVLSVLLGLMALPMFASDITFGGDVTFGFVTDFSGERVAAEETDLTFDVKAAIDDYNSLAISMTAWRGAPSHGTLGCGHCRPWSPPTSASGSTCPSA